MKTQRGFTLVELVVVIIILGVLAAIAVPKFINLSVDAHNAAGKSVAGSIAAATMLNFAAKRTGNAGATTLADAEVCTGALLTGFVSGVTLVDVSPTTDATFQMGGTGDCSGSNLTVTCTVTPYGTGVTAANAVVYCAR